MRTFFRLFAFLLLSQQLLAQTTIERIDPPNWWSGMKNSHLQLLVHGKNIGNTHPNINLKSIEMLGAERLSDNYLAINLDLRNTRPMNFVIDFFENTQKVASTRYTINERQIGSANRKGFDASDAIYLIMPDRFANGDPSNDNSPGMAETANRANPNGRHGGDIRGITEHLDYINQLGMTTIWSTPLLENNMPAYSYHGYAITDFYQVDPRYGTNADYRNLVEQAHAKGMKVVMDMVFNHFGTSGYLFTDMPQKDWVNQWPEFTRSNYRALVMSDPYRSQFDSKKMEQGWFDHSMADFNQSNPYVARFLIQNSIWWVEYAGLDGIRQDTYPYCNKDFMATWMKELREEFPGFSTVGEAWINYPAQVAYWQDNSRNKDGYRSYLTHVFDFPLMMALQKALQEPEGWDTGLMRLYELLSMDFLYNDPSAIITFTDNHDIERMYQVLGSPERVKMALGFSATTRGIPLVYYGTEALSDRGNLEGDPGKRKDFPGGWTGDSINYFTQTHLSPQQADVYHFMQKLYTWRKSSQVVQKGKLTHYIPDNGIYVYFRTLDGQTVMVIMNNNDQITPVETSRFAENIQGFRQGRDVIGGSMYPLSQSLSIPAKSILILELSR